ncbi:MAG TPA: OpgC domain-containing protein [Candidatus Saccharimonas sp.]|nr:OpgC domain-containing protein [Candidatus Saccharimonas sp.]
MDLTQKRPRILALDLLRGYFLFVIIIDHAGLFPSIFEFFSGRGELWASAAEGFFIISGLLVGYIYGPRMVKSVATATKKIWKRAFLLYAVSVVATWVFVLWGNLSGSAAIKEGLWTQPQLGDFLFKTLTLHYYYGWTDFLPYYAIFMVFAPLALWACTKRLGWAVILVSGIVWLLRGQSFEMAWQFLFMPSIVLGWYLPHIEAKFRSLQPRTRKIITRSVCAAALATFLLSEFCTHLAEYMVDGYQGFVALPPVVKTIFSVGDGIREFMTPLIIKWTLEPARIAVAVLWFGAMYLFIRQHETAINRFTHGFFTFLGERSLVVYVTHAIVIFVVSLTLQNNQNFVINSILTAAVITAVYVLVRVWLQATQIVKLLSGATVRAARQWREEPL